MPQLTEPANLPPVPFNQTGAVFVNATIRQTLQMSVGASQLRLQISNAFGLTNLPVTSVTVALPVNNSAGIHQIQPSTLQKVTFSGSSGISIPNGALAVSDPLNFKIKPQSILTVTIYLATGQTTNSITSHPGSRTTSFWQFGNAVSASQLDITDAKTQSAAHWYFVSAVQAWVPPAYGTLALVGDSITDGRGSETDKNNRWPNLLFARLQKSSRTNEIAIVNQAAGGNRVLIDGLGPNALGRIDRDVLAHPGVKYAMIFEGVNDIGTAATTPEAQAVVYDGLVQAYKQMVTRIHSFGIPVFGATITPFSAPSNFTGQPYSDPEREKTRQKVNKFIRESGTFDAVVSSSCTYLHAFTDMAPGGFRQDVGRSKDPESVAGGVRFRRLPAPECEGVPASGGPVPCGYIQEVGGRCRRIHVEFSQKEEHEYAIRICPKSHAVALFPAISTCHAL